MTDDATTASLYFWAVLELFLLPVFFVLGWWAHARSVKPTPSRPSHVLDPTRIAKIRRLLKK